MTRYREQPGGYELLWPAIRTKVSLVGGCWVWVGARSGNGYGAFKHGSRTILAHRLVYEVVVGPIPRGLSLDHLCGNKACVNPAHLEPVTHRENMRRATSEVCKYGHAFTPRNTYVSNRGSRHCRACDAARHRRYRQSRE
jgi:hypothetical protein